MSSHSTKKRACKSEESADDEGKIVDGESSEVLLVSDPSEENPAEGVGDTDDWDQELGLTWIELHGFR